MSTYIGTTRTTYFYLALGKYGSYHRDTSSNLEKSILYKVLPNLYSVQANLGRNLVKFLLYKLVKMKVVTPTLDIGTDSIAPINFFARARPGPTAGLSGRIRPIISTTPEVRFQ